MWQIRAHKKKNLDIIIILSIRTVPSSNSLTALHLLSLKTSEDRKYTSLVFIGEDELWDFKGKKQKSGNFLPVAAVLCVCESALLFLIM